MNKNPSIYRVHRACSLSAAGVRAIHWCGLLFAILLATGFGGCADRDAVKIKLQAETAGKDTALRLKIQGQVIGPQAGLHYKWLSISGQCDPQESEVPSTLFKFAEGVKQDCVTAEVWRDGKRIAQSEIAVKYAGEIAELPATKEEPRVQIEIVQIPPWEAGGEDTRANISGRVSGPILPDYRVVVYARAYESWYMQPTAHGLHTIRKDNTWMTWTHTGEQYAALIVTPGFAPRVRSDMLPTVGGNVLARVIVEGIKN